MSVIGTFETSCDVSCLVCRFSDAGMTKLSTRGGGRRPKSANARSRGKYGTLQCSECYGDRMLGAISMMGGRRARRHLDVCTREVGRVQ